MSADIIRTPADSYSDENATQAKSLWGLDVRHLMRVLAIAR